MTSRWIDLGALADFPPDVLTLRKDGSERFVCVRRGDAVHALADRCPHQGYPLSQGALQGDLLTCQWHNWKFDVQTGGCTFGGEDVRRYATRVLGGRVHLDVAVDEAKEAARAALGIERAVRDNDAARALREGLRLDQVTRAAPDARLVQAFGVVARDGAARAEYGFDHGLAALADLSSWAERGWFLPDEAFLLATIAVAEPSVHLPARAAPTLDVSNADDPSEVIRALVDERRSEAEARIRAVVRERGAEVAILEGLLPFASRHLYDYGHGLIFLAKARELARRFPEAAVDVIAAVTLHLAWATAETALPPFAATRAGSPRLSRGSSRARS